MIRSHRLFDVKKCKDVEYGRTEERAQTHKSLQNTSLAKHSDSNYDKPTV